MLQPGARLARSGGARMWLRLRTVRAIYYVGESTVTVVRNPSELHKRSGSVTTAAHLDRVQDSAFSNAMDSAKGDASNMGAMAVVVHDT
jgi:hypothetical protein